MPQLPEDVIPAFLKSFQDRGVKVTKERQMVGKLKATQGEINAEKVTGMAQAKKEGKYDPSKQPIIVSRDGYVLDGHHRWAATLLDNPSNEMNTYTVDTDIRDLLSRADNFEGVKKQGFGEASDMGEKPKMSVQEMKAATSKMKEERVGLQHRNKQLKHELNKPKSKGTPWTNEAVAKRQQEIRDGKRPGESMAQKSIQMQAIAAAIKDEYEIGRAQI